MITQGAFNLLFRPGLRSDFRDEWDRYPQEYPMFLRTGNTSVPEVSATIMTGPSRLLERGDGEPITYEDAVMGPKVAAVDKEFALGFMITRRTVEDDQYGKARSSSKWLAHAGRMTYEYRSAALLDDAFAGSTFKGIDGLALCHTAHTLINSSTTVGNRPSTDIAVSIAGFTACQDLFTRMKDENGDPVVVWPNKLILGNDNGTFNRAWQILKSAGEPFTANNQDNAMKARFSGISPEMSHYKSSTTSYFFIDDKWNDAWILVRRAMEFDDTFDFDTQAAKYMATTRFLIWFVDWRGWVGQNPS